MIKKINKNIIFIPARKGSSRIKNKNIQRINSLSLIEICIKKAIALKKHDFQIILSTDYTNKELGIDKFLLDKIFIHNRSSKVSQNNSSTESTLKEMLDDNQFKNLKDSNGFILMMQVTSPLLEIKSIQDGINLYKDSDKKNTTIFSAYKYKQFTWIEKDKHFEAISYDPENRENTQKMGTFFQETGGFYIFPIKGFLKKFNRFMDLRLPLLINQIESLDIDEANDLETARKYFKCF